MRGKEEQMRNIMRDVVFTKAGNRKVQKFLAKFNHTRKILVNSGEDTAEDIPVPDKEDIRSDIRIFADEFGKYWNCWSVTENHDLCLMLSAPEDFRIRKPQIIY